MSTAPEDRPTPPAHLTYVKDSQPATMSDSPFFTGFLLQRLTKDVERMKKHLNGVYGDIQYVRGAIQNAGLKPGPRSSGA